jgi:hypothetical protein
MKWEKRGAHYYCTTYPFFDLSIRYCKSEYYNNKIPYYTYNQTNYQTLELAKKAAILRVKKACKEFLTNPEKFNFDNNWVIIAKYTNYGANTGGCKYVKSEYQWLRGAMIPNYGPYIEYRIRFDKNISYTDIDKYRLKIIKRHCIKFLKDG